MTAGLPGAGIGGMFYLIGALLAPAWETLRALRGDRSPRRWRLVLRHFCLAGAILSGIVITGWIIGLMMTSPVATTAGSGAAWVDPAYPRVIARHMALFTMSTLGAVVLLVEALRWCVAGTTRSTRARATHLPVLRGTMPPQPIVATDDAA